MHWACLNIETGGNQYQGWKALCHTTAAAGDDDAFVQHHNHHVLVFFLNVIAWLYPRNVDLLCSAGNYWVTLFIHQVT